MKNPMPQLTTGLLLLHMAFGCCWHHAHTEAANDCTASGVSAGSCCDGHRQPREIPTRDVCYRSADDHRSNRLDGPHDIPRNGPAPGRHQCEGNRCIFVRSERSPAEEGRVCVLVPALDLATTALPRVTLSCRSTANHRARGQFDVPPRRLHLRFAVLLI